MSGARTSTLATLRGRIERIETHGDAYAPNKVALGHAGADATLRGGLAMAAVHEVFAEGHQSAAATGFIHESYNRNNSAVFTRSWFAWANTLFGELIAKTAKHNPGLLG